MKYTIQTMYASHWMQTVEVEADNVDQACQKAIDDANENGGWESVDYASATWIERIAQGSADLYDNATKLETIPRELREDANDVPSKLVIAMEGGVLQNMMSERGNIDVEVRDFDIDDYDSDERDRLRMDENGNPFMIAEWQVRAGEEEVPAAGPTDICLYCRAQGQILGRSKVDGGGAYVDCPECKGTGQRVVVIEGRAD